MSAPEACETTRNLAANGEAEGRKTALQLAAEGTLQAIEDFDWAEWSGGSSGGTHHEPKVREEHLRDIFGDGENWLTRKRAAEQLQECAEVGRSAAYDALKLTFRLTAFRIKQIYHK